MAANAGHRLTLDPMGKYSNAFFSETTNVIKAKQFSFNCPSGFREEAF
jgi:cyclopropane fatty-acyl-phospholipid synthase-like methyltransferase